MDSHHPPCSDWRDHVRKAVDELQPSEGFRLRDFVVEVEATWDDERLAADPEYPFMLGAQPRFAA